jgi:hypothetical protein
MRSSCLGQPSLADWLVGTLQEWGPQTLDQLGQRLPNTNWAQLLLAVDYLSRNGLVTVGLISRGDYLVSLSKLREPSERASGEPSMELASATKI